jgi:DNA-binding CsgD family transcriptional regulator
LHYSRRLDDAIAVLDHARTLLDDTDAELDEELEALTLHYMSFDPALRASRLTRLHRLGDRRGASEVAYRRRLAELASEAQITVRPADEAAALAERALAGGSLLSRDPSAHVKAALTLAYAGRPATARAHLQDAIAEARRRADTVRMGFAIATHGEVRRLEGEMAAAELDTRTGLELLPPGELGPRFMVRALIEALVEQGRVDEAIEELRNAGLAGELPEVMPTPSLLYARARARIAAGSVTLGLEDLLRAGEIAERLELRDPCSVPWRLAAAEALVVLGDRVRAGELVEEHLQLARRARVREVIGAALRVRAVLIGGSSGRAALEEAVELLDGGWARLELARALVDLGAEQRQRDPAMARASFDRGAGLAERLGATALARRAAELLIAAGGRPRRATRHGTRSLTAAERRTARLAMEGMTNREIAETLILSEKTIGSQLTSAFRKLGIRSRAQLADALLDSASAERR